MKGLAATVWNLIQPKTSAKPKSKGKSKGGNK